MTPRKQLGDFGERVAANRLDAEGMRIVGRNVRVGRIEVDIVAEDGEDLVFVEVRTRRGAAGLAAESLGAAKLRRMWQGALRYCDEHGVVLERARIDVVAVDLDANGAVRDVVHFRGIEIPEGLEE